jgi:subtilisin family serine protease
MRVCKLVMVLCIITVAGLVPWNQTWASFLGEEKILDSNLVEDVTMGLGTVRVIVTLQGYEDFKGLTFEGNKSMLNSVHSQVAMIQDKAISKLNTQEVQVGVRLENLPIFSATISEDGLKSLAGMGDVAFIEEDLPLELQTAQGIPQIHPGSFRSSPGGSGAAVAIVDSGVDYRHPAFAQSKVIGGYDFVEKDSDPMDVYGHGTSCAGIVAGLNTGSGSYIGGVAPKTKIYALRIALDNLRNYASTLLKAWDWCISNKNANPNYPIVAISNSTGTPTYFSGTHCPIRSGAAVAATAVANGIAIFVSSGNAGMCDGISYPACLKDTISVGAVYDANVLPPGKQILWPVHPNSCIAKRTGNPRYPYVCQETKTAQDQVCCYSNSAQILDLLAPSHCAYTAGFPGGKYSKCFGGTSAACPYAAGAAAVIQSHFKAKTGKFLTVAQLKDLMVRNGDPVKDAKSGLSVARVNIERSVQAAGAPGDEVGPEESDVGRRLREIWEKSKGK